MPTVTFSGTFPLTVILTCRVGVLSGAVHLVAAVMKGTCSRSSVCRYKGYFTTTAQRSVASASNSSKWKGPSFSATYASRSFGAKTQLPLFSRRDVIFRVLRAVLTAVAA